MTQHFTKGGFEMANKTYSGVPGDSRCECADSGCAAHKDHTRCNELATTILYRVDMEDNTGTAMCDACTEDAFDSGLFTTNDYDEIDDEEDHAALITQDGWEDDGERGRR